MRIVFMGATELGWNCCRALLEIGQEVVGIFSIPQKFRISWSATPVTNVQYKSFGDIAAAHSIPIFYVTGKMSDPECKEALRGLPAYVSKVLDEHCSGRINQRLLTGHS